MATPTTLDVYDALAHRLAAAYPQLAASAHGPEETRELIADLDDMPEGFAERLTHDDLFAVSLAWTKVTADVADEHLVDEV